MATLKDLLVSGPARVIGNITGKSFIKEGGTSSQFLKADGSVDSNTYSTTSHNHSGTYKPIQTAVSSPSASATTSTTFIDTISQNTNGVIAATKKTLPTASTTVAGITTVGASGGAAAYSHNHTTSIATSTSANQITLAFGTKYAITAGGTSYVFTMPANPNTNTTYTFATGDSNGQIKVTPSGGDAYNVSVKGLGSAAYTESSAYATSGHTHTGYATSNHTHATSIATSTSANQITLAFGTKYAITAGGTSYVFTMPTNPNTNTTYTFATGDSNGQIKVTPSGGSAQNVSVKGLGSAAYTESSAYATSGHTHSGVYKPVQTAVSSPSASSTSSAFIDTISQDKNGVITATKKNIPTASTTVVGVTTVGAAGGAAAYSHNHSDVYKPVQTAVSDPTASTSTSTTFIDTISQDKNGVITATKKTLPTASTTVAGITTVGASGGAAAYSHNHTTSIATSTSANQITLAFGTKYAITAGGTSYVFTMPANPNTNTTYTFATGDSNGQIKVTPSGGSAQNVSVKGLGSAAYTESSAYATSGHTHTGYATSNHTHATSIATSNGTNQITLAFGTKYAITAGGTSYVFTMPANPNTNTTYTFATGDSNGQIKVTPSGGSAQNVSVKGLGSAAYTESSAYATSGHNHSGVYKPVQTAVSSPSASSTSTAFIDTISQNINGVITATKKNIPTASTTVIGITTVGAAGGAAAYSHNHSGVYKPVQTAVSDPTASTTASTTFIDTISQDKNGVITATKKTLPTASSTVAGITTVGASGGAAAYSHNHTTSIAKSTEDNQITLAFGGKYTISAGGTSYVFTMPKNPNTDTTYTFESGDGNGQIKVTSSTGDVYDVKVSGLGSAAFTDGSEYAPVGHVHTGYATSSHTHATSIATSNSTSQITLAFGGKYTISAGGSSYVFTMPANPDTNTKYTIATGDEKGQIKVIPSSGDAYNVNVSGLGSAAYTDSIDYATSGHTHGSITNAGAIANNTTIANGDHLVITDKSDSNKIKRASITFGTSQSTYLRNDGEWGTPSTSTPTPLATPLFDDGGGGIPGTVIPIAATENEVAYKGNKITYNTIPSLIFPSASSTMALPIFMDKSGHLFMLISTDFANLLINKYGYSTTTSGGKS